MRLRFSRRESVLQIEALTGNIMKLFFKIKLFISLFFLSFSSYSEGNCPAGYYPIGGQGVSGCAPMSSGGAQAPQAAGEWQTRWGALARNEDSSILGVASKERSKSAARATALKFCEEGGAENVRSRFTTRIVVLHKPLQ